MREDVVSYVAIEAQNTWGNFVRAYYLSCWFGLKLDGGSRIVTSPVFPARTDNDLLGWAVNRYRKPKNKKTPGSNGAYDPRDEPPWYRLKTLLDLCADLNCSNIATVQSAVSANPTVFALLPDFRNFFAHRNRHTEGVALAAASSLGLPPGLGPARALVYRPVTKSVSTLGQWLIDLEDAVEALSR